MRVKSLVHQKKQEPLLRLPSQNAVTEGISFLTDIPEGVIAYTLAGKKRMENPDNIYCCSMEQQYPAK